MSGLVERVFLAVILGILLLIIGSGVNSEWVSLIGALIFAAALFWGGFFLRAESLALRITLLAIAGLAAIALISDGSMSQYIPSL